MIGLDLMGTEDAPTQHEVGVFFGGVAAGAAAVGGGVLVVAGIRALLQRLSARRETLARETALAGGSEARAKNWIAAWGRHY